MFCYFILLVYRLVTGRNVALSQKQSLLEPAGGE